MASGFLRGFICSANFNAKASLKPRYVLVGTGEYDGPGTSVHKSPIHLGLVLSGSEQESRGRIHLLGKYLAVPMMMMDFDPRVIATLDQQRGSDELWAANRPACVVRRRDQNLWRIPTIASSCVSVPEFAPYEPTEAAAFTIAPLAFSVLPLAFW